MKTKPLAIKIATLTRKIKETEDVTAKKTLKTKLAVLKKQLSESKEDTNIKSENLSKAKIQVDKMTKKDFNEYIKKLSKNEDYKFLGLMTKEEIIDDIKEVAKPVGWRFRGNNNRVPSKKQVTLGRKSGDVYYENRSNRSDVSRVVRLEDGGFITDKKNSEISIGTWLLNSPDGRKMIKKSKNSNELENNAIEYMKSGDIIHTMPNGEVMLDSEHYAKGGNVVSIAKKVAEVNALIESANELNLSVVDTSSTWQSPMKYKPFKYSNGTLYEEYQEMDLYKHNKEKGTTWVTKKGKVLKANMQYDNPLNEVAKMYRKALKHYDTYGYANGGEMAKGGSISDIGFENSNLYLYGFGIDNNGNSIVKVGFPNQRAFSIQTNGVLQNTHNLNRTKLSELSSGDIASIENEVVDYVKNYGSITQKKSLKIYGNKMAKGGGVGMMAGGTIYDKIKSVDNWKFTNGYGFVFEVNNKKIGFLAYNSGSDTKKYTVKESLNLSSLKNLSEIVDNSIILSIQSHYYDKAHEITKMELSGNDLEMLIVTNHNVNSFEIFKQDKMASSMALGGKIKTKYEEYNSREAYGRKKLEELKQKGIFYGKKGLQPWQKESLKHAENEIIKAVKNKEKLLYNAYGIKKVMSNNELKQSTYTGTAIRGFSYPSKGYEFSTSNPGYVMLNLVSLEKFNSVIKDLQDSGFVIEEKKEPSKSIVGMVSSITVKPFYTEQEVLSIASSMAKGGQMRESKDFVLKDKSTYQADGKWFATASKVYPKNRDKDAMSIKGEGYTKKEALDDLENNLSYYAKGGGLGNNMIESLVLIFKDEKQFEKAKEHFENDSDFYPNDIDEEFRAFYFIVQDQDDADSTEYYLEQELQETDLTNFYFSSEDGFDYKMAKGGSLDKGYNAKTLMDLKPNDFVWKEMERYNPQLGTYYTINKAKIFKVSPVKIWLDSYGEQDDNFYDRNTGEQLKTSKSSYGSAWYKLYTHQQALEMLKTNSDKYRKDVVEKVMNLNQEDVLKMAKGGGVSSADKRVTESQYDDMMEVLPPIMFDTLDGEKVRGFAVDEPSDHKMIDGKMKEVYQGYYEVKEGGKTNYYAIGEYVYFDDKGKALRYEKGSASVSDEPSMAEIIEEIVDEKSIPESVVEQMIQEYGLDESNVKDWFDEHYEGEYNSDEDLAYGYVDMIGGIDALGKQTLESYFDYSAFGRDLANDFHEHEGHYFRYKNGGMMAKGGGLGEGKTLKDIYIKEKNINKFIGKKVYYNGGSNVIVKTKPNDLGNVLVEGTLPTEKDKQWYVNIKDLIVINDDYADGGEIGSKYCVVMSGGSIGTKGITDKKGRKLVQIFETRNDAVAFAKRRNQQLSPGEKKYYKIKYFIAPYKESDFITTMADGGEIGDLTKLNKLEDYVYENMTQIKNNQKRYDFENINEITNPYDFANLLGVDSRIFKDADISFYAEYIAGLLESNEEDYDKMADGGNIVTYQEKKYKKQPNGKWLEISKRGLTKQEHSEKINEFASKPNAHFEYNYHMSNANKLSNKEYTDNEIGLDKMADGGTFSEYVIFSVDDEELDMLLHDLYGNKLDYVELKSDSYYKLNRRDFDRFIDAADSRGFDVDYENSEDAVINIEEDVYAKGGSFIGKQKNLDRNKNGKIDSEDLRMIRENKMEKGGWIGTKVYRKVDKKEFKVDDFKNYGSYQELFVKSNDGEKIEITLGNPYKKNDFLNNWSTNKMADGGEVGEKKYVKVDNKSDAENILFYADKQDIASSYRKSEKDGSYTIIFEKKLEITNDMQPRIKEILENQKTKMAMGGNLGEPHRTNIK